MDPIETINTHIKKKVNHAYSNEKNKIIPPRSPILELRELEHRIEIENEENNNELRTCCGNNTSDKRLLIFIASFSISIITLVFSAIQLVRVDSCESHNYISIICLIIGIWLRSPI